MPIFTTVGIALFFKNLAGWVVAHWRVVIAVIALITVIFAVLTVQRACTQRKINKRHDQIRDLDANTQDAQTNSGILTNRLQGAEENTNKAAENTNRIMKQNLNTFDGNFDAANNRFCKEFPNDPGC